MPTLHHQPWPSLYRLWQQYWADAPAAGLKQADRWLNFYFKTHKNHGKRDRRFLTQWFFAGLRHGIFALFCEDLLTQTTSLENHAAWLQPNTLLPALLHRMHRLPAQRFFTWIRLRCGETEMLAPEVMASYQSCEKYLKSHPELAAQMLWHSIPFGYVTPLQERAHDHWQWQAFVARQDEKPPLWLRVKSGTDLASLVAELNEHDLTVITQHTLSHHTALAVSGEKGIYELPSYQQGLIEIQDLASQYIGDAIHLTHPKSFILDACAGGGGKTLQIAALLNHQGAVYASDIREYKLEEIKRRAKKAQFGNIRTFAWDWTVPQLPALPREVSNRQGFDWVLVDAPCSSSGTWRRNPDAKWRFELSTLPQLTALQLTLLTQAAHTLHAEGQLVYSTCSFLPEENEQIIEQFLLANPTFQLTAMKLLGAPLYDCDTMFVAVLERKK